MAHSYKKQLTPYARRLRRAMTEEEKHLWYDFLKYLPITVHRQKSIGQYIVDFYIAKFQLVIELDGSQHSDSENKASDEKRDAYFSSLGITVVRYPNSLIHFNFDGVCEDILHHLGISRAEMKQKTRSF